MPLDTEYRCCKLTQGPLQRHVRVGPVDQEEIDIVRSQAAQALVQLATDVRHRRCLGMQELCRQPDVTARYRRALQRPADRLLVPAEPRSADVPLALGEHRLYERTDGLTKRIFFP